MKQERFEHKHIECAHDTNVVNAVLQMYELFYWESTQTQTIVSKESHLEDGSVMDGLDDVVLGRKTTYSVTTTEEFVAINLRRNKNNPKLKQIKSIEKEYFQIVYQLEKLGCSIIDNYESPPPREVCSGSVINYFNPFFFISHPIGYISNTFRLLIYPVKYILGNRKKKLEQHRELKTKLDQLVESNAKILSV